MEAKNKIVQYLLIIPTFFLIIFISASGQAATHYVAPNGTDTWEDSTNINKPTSIAKANARAVAADVVFLRGGNYGSQKISPSNSGSSGHVITFAKYTGETPIFSTGSRNSVYISGTSYILIDGLTFTGGTKQQIQILNRSSYIEVKNCTFGEMSDYGNMQIIDSSYCYVHDNYFNAGVAGRTEGTEADSLQIKASHHNRVIDNVFTDGNGHGQVTTMFPTAQYNVVRGNTFIITDVFDYLRDANDFSLGNIQGPSYNLYEENTFYEIGTNPIINTGALKSSSGKYNIWRKNLIYNFDKDGWDGYVVYGNALEYNTVYNNTFYNLNYGSTGLGVINVNAGNSNTRYNQFVNNIIHTSGVDGYRLQHTFQAYVTNNEFRNGIVYNITGDPVDWFGKTLTIAQANSNYPLELTGNLAVDPKLTNPSTGNMTLQADSPAIDAGAWLTTITSATGEGTTFAVSNPYFFYDGYGIPGETGDTIKTQNGKTATISSINYSKGKITLDKSIGWINGEGIALNYHGTRPDIGAIEYSGGSSLLPPQGLAVITAN